MAKIDPAEILKAKMATLEEKEKEKENEKLKKYEAEILANIPYKENEKEINIVKEDVPYLEIIDEIAEDEETQNYLKDNSLKLLNITANASIELGKIYEEVAEFLSKKGNSEGIYVKWLEANGINKMTALRHRKKYRLYVEVKEEYRKTVILLPTRAIENIFKDEEEKKIVIEYINKGSSVEEIKNLLEGKQIENAENKKINFEIDDVGNMTEKAQVIFTEFNQRIERLPDDKKKKVNDLLIRIEKILMTEE